MSAVTSCNRTRLLEVDPNARLGAGGVHEIKAAAFFESIDWNANLWQTESVYAPNLADPLDTSNFQMNAQARVHAHQQRQQLEEDHASGDEAESGDSNPGEKEEASFRYICVTSVTCVNATCHMRGIRHMRYLRYTRYTH